MTIGERIKKVRKTLDLTQQEFADQLRMKRNSIAQVEGGRNTSEQTIFVICKTFNISESWLRTGEGEMFVPKEADALDELVKQYGLSDGDYILIQKFLTLKPVERQAVITYMKDVVAALNAGTALPGPDSTTTSDRAGQERIEPDVMAELAELKRQNQELATKVAAMEEEDALLGLTDVFSASPSVSVGNIRPAEKSKK